MLRVLVVDDNVAMRALIRGLVDGISEVVECDSGEAAVARYAGLRPRPDWVLMDIRLSGMGGMDGIEATRALRRADPGARVVIVTEHGDMQSRRAAIEAGATGFVLKDDLRRLPGLLTGAESAES